MNNYNSSGARSNTDPHPLSAMGKNEDANRGLHCCLALELVL